MADSLYENTNEEDYLNEAPVSQNGTNYFVII